MKTKPSLPRAVQAAAVVLAAILVLTGAFWENGKPAPAAPAPAEAKAQPPAVALSQGATASRQTAIVTAAARVTPAVVSIGAERPAYVPFPGAFNDPFFGPQIVQKIRKKTPFIGSGIVVDNLGHVVTNFHVVQGASRLFVTLANNGEYEAQLVDYDEVADIAILKVNAANLRPAPLGDSDKVMLGEWALAVGNPYGNIIEDPTPTVTAGVVSARNRTFRAGGGDESRLYEGMIQTDAAINPGNSGGALANAAGEIIGVNTFIISESGGSVGLGFAIPINKVKRMMSDLTRYGHVRKPEIDFEPIALTPSLQQQMGLPMSKGLLVYRMQTEGPAASAGLQLGDVITQINGQPAPTREDFLSRLYSAPVGSKLKLAVFREGESLTIEYEVREKPRER